MDDEYQVFLTNELKQATQSQDARDEVHLIMVQYHQAMLQSLQEIRFCPACTAAGLQMLATRAKHLQQTSFANGHELIEACTHQLRDVTHLCNSCQDTFQHDMLTAFFQIRTHQRH